MADGRASPGQVFKPPPARIWNSMIEAGLDYERRKLNDGGVVPLPIATDVVRILNNTGDDLPIGSVVEIGDPIETTPNKYFPKFNGELADDTGLGIGITLAQIETAGAGDVQMSGVVFAQVNITDILHHRADVKAGEIVLESHTYGRAEILWAATGSTGQQLCFVRLGHKNMWGFYRSAAGTIGVTTNTFITIDDGSTPISIGAIAQRDSDTAVEILKAGYYRLGIYITASNVTDISTYVRQFLIDLSGTTATIISGGPYRFFVATPDPLQPSFFGDGAWHGMIYGEVGELIKVKCAFLTTGSPTVKGYITLEYASHVEYFSGVADT